MTFCSASATVFVPGPRHGGAELGQGQAAAPQVDGAEVDGGGNSGVRSCPEKWSPVHFTRRGTGAA